MNNILYIGGVDDDYHLFYYYKKDNKIKRYYNLKSKKLQDILINRGLDILPYLFLTNIVNASKLLELL